MTNPREMAEFFGFTEQEVELLCKQYNRSFEEARAWYDGYELVTMDGDKQKIYAMYSPKSVVDAMLTGMFDHYWNQTETYEALKAYIRMNFDGLKDAVVRMLAGDRIRIHSGTFTNDMTTFQGKDDVLTLLVHLGYLSYHWQDKTVSIPNKEVSQEYADICFIPRKLYSDKPAAVIELKWDKNAAGAIAQIKEKQYVDALMDYRGNLLLVGIDYNKKTKKHVCVIEKWRFNLSWFNSPQLAAGAFI